MKQPGELVRLHYDTDVPVEVGHVLRTQTGRQYGVVEVRQQKRGIHAGHRYHVRAVVLDDDAEIGMSVVHPVYWYSRRRRPA